MRSRKQQGQGIGEESREKEFEIRGTLSSQSTRGQIAPTSPSCTTNMVEIRGDRPHEGPDSVDFADEDKLCCD